MSALLEALHPRLVSYLVSHCVFFTPVSMKYRQLCLSRKIAFIIRTHFFLVVIQQSKAFTIGALNATENPASISPPSLMYVNTAPARQCTRRVSTPLTCFYIFSTHLSLWFYSGIESLGDMRFASTAYIMSSYPVIN